MKGSAAKLTEDRPYPCLRQFLEYLTSKGAAEFQLLAFPPELIRLVLFNWPRKGKRAANQSKMPFHADMFYFIKKRLCGTRGFVTMTQVESVRLVTRI